MTTKINKVPAKRPETEQPIAVEKDPDREKEIHEKAERAADRAAHKANKTEQEYDRDHNTFSSLTALEFWTLNSAVLPGCRAFFTARHSLPTRPISAFICVNFQTSSQQELDAGFALRQVQNSPLRQT